jgi:hypothetical protein
MITLLLAFVLAHFDAHWGWWTAFGFVMVKNIFDEVMK